ncbi:hypothetical protein VD0004_g2418 [Verticillium dahliae]|uniref:40S ribosomal protein S30 n=1 Tax=Verticillium dahliae TaxID=27337 RepID=A0AA45ANM9_VERDA|nr:hypothetical protein BJF96_g3801 [Verticillium dahliae]PNH45190.1 hypothetical protein VD0003_g9281 [Verticillium dahliae]PNH45491.1 hypothetical protein VD0004_g2418 [Verticillium dahliae]PNH63852.1 hypothetical protein VD0001_g9031 [Verticillium dahliae]
MPRSPAHAPYRLCQHERYGDGRIRCNTQCRTAGLTWFLSSFSSPKVEKQEKKKVPKGRAKKRLTYTRRFVNVQLTGGKRKMNPNPGAA